MQKTHFQTKPSTDSVPELPVTKVPSLANLPIVGMDELHYVDPSVSFLPSSGSDWGSYPETPNESVPQLLTVENMQQFHSAVNKKLSSIAEVPEKLPEPVVFSNKKKKKLDSKSSNTIKQKSNPSPMSQLTRDESFTFATVFPQPAV